MLVCIDLDLLILDLAHDDLAFFRISLIYPDVSLFAIYTVCYSVA